MNNLQPGNQEKWEANQVEYWLFNPRTHFASCTYTVMNSSISCMYMYSSMLSVYFRAQPHQIWGHKDYYIQVILGQLEKYELKKKSKKSILHFVQNNYIMGLQNHCCDRPNKNLLKFVSSALSQSFFQEKIEVIRDNKFLSYLRVSRLKKPKKCQCTQDFTYYFAIVHLKNDFDFVLHVEKTPV